MDSVVFPAYYLFPILAALWAIAFAIRASGTSREQPGGIAGAGPWRSQAIAEAMRRNPSLASANTPEQLALFNELVAQIEQELALRHELEGIQRSERLREAAQQGALIRQISRDERKTRARRRRARIESRYARWPLVKNVLLNPVPTIVVGGIAVLLAIIAVATLTSLLRDSHPSQTQSAQRSTSDISEAVERQQLLGSCDPSTVAMFDRIDAEVLDTWARCPQPETRAFVAAAFGIPRSTVELLATDDSREVRLAVAKRRWLPADVVAGLALDEDSAVRDAILESNPGLADDAADSDATFPAAPNVPLTDAEAVRLLLFDTEIESAFPELELTERNEIVVQGPLAWAMTKNTKPTECSILPNWGQDTMESSEGEIQWKVFKYLGTAVDADDLESTVAIYQTIVIYESSGTAEAAFNEIAVASQRCGSWTVEPGGLTTSAVSSLDSSTGVLTSVLNGGEYVQKITLDEDRLVATAYLTLDTNPDGLVRNRISALHEQARARASGSN